MMDDFWRRIPLVLFSDEQCPECTHPAPLSTVIMCLNDSHKWTRERIADWLESLEVPLVFKDEPVDALEVYSRCPECAQVRGSCSSVYFHMKTRHKTDRQNLNKFTMEMLG